MHCYVNVTVHHKCFECYVGVSRFLECVMWIHCMSGMSYYMDVEIHEDCDNCYMNVKMYNDCVVTWILKCTRIVLLHAC